MTLSRQDQDWKLLIDRSDPSIPESKIIDLGWQFTSHFLVIQVSVLNQRDTWQSGGTIWATSYIRGYTTRFFSHNLDLFAQELLIIPNIFNEKYSLYYRAPKYFNNVKIKIWQYTKESIKESEWLTDKIDLLVNHNLRIEGLIQSLTDKIDALSNKTELPTEQQKKLIVFF